MVELKLVGRSSRLRRTVLICLLVGMVSASGVATERQTAAQQNASGLIAEDLRCESLRDPLGIDAPRPRLSWKLKSLIPGRRGQGQTAWQILVAGERRLLDLNQGNLWDSGQVKSEQSLYVPYGGKCLDSRMRCWWKVRVWDEQGETSDWSKPAFWSMGLLTDKSWTGAKWIGLNQEKPSAVPLTDLKQSQWTWYPEGNPTKNAPVGSRYFRRTIVIPHGRSIRRAMCFFAGDDLCVLDVNGTQAGISRGHPNLIGVDLARRLHVGVNLLAVVASNVASVPQNPAGWILSLRVEFDHGPPLVITSSEDWKCSREGKKGWDNVGFDDSRWVTARKLGKPGIRPWGIPWPDTWQSEHRRLPARYLRRAFRIKKTVRRATAFVSGLGFFDLFVNGRLIGDQLMNPALTGYDKRVLYATFDVTSTLRRGENALGVVLSNGRFFAPRIRTPVTMRSYGYPKLLLQLHLEFTDGTEQTLVSDRSWNVTAAGPIRSSNEFDGEEYDARREMPGWSASGFDDSTWQAAQIVAPPGGELEAQMIEPIRVTERLRPRRITQPKPGIFMVDFGQAFYGVVQLTATAPAGTRVSMRTSFNRQTDGTLNAHNDRSALNTDIYTFKGRGVETWHPRFRGNATRWVQVEGFPGTPTNQNFTGLVTHTDMEPVGKFACSNSLINRIYRNARWGTRLQNRSVPMEPDRDERMPWSGHPAKTSESEGWVFNVARFYAHFLHNYRAHQSADGSLGEILPPYWSFNTKDIVWPSVATIIPDWYYNFYGDDRLLRDNYAMMKRFLEYHRRAHLRRDFTIDHCSYGDWVDTASIGGNSRNSGATSHPLIATAYFYHDCRIVERAARLLKHPDDEQTFRKLAEKVRDGFNKRFFDVKSGMYASKTQCASVLPLAFGLVPATHRPMVIDNLVNDIAVKHTGHTSVGLIGMQWQMQVLTDIGHPELGYRIATRTDRPSWGYMISKGATTIWERWDTDTQGGGMNGESQKILSGNFEAWCYQTLAGINYDPKRPGFKHIIFRPRLVGDLKWVNASHISSYGAVRSRWSLTGDKLRWHITVPPNTTATVYVPADRKSFVHEGTEQASKSPGIRLIRRERHAVILEVGSGDYEFASRWTPPPQTTDQSPHDKP